MASKAIRKLKTLELRGKRVFVRVDFNVPLNRKVDPPEVADLTRVKAALPTIQYIQKMEGKVILASHLGRPDGEPNPKYSLAPVGLALSELLGKDVHFTEDCVGDAPRELSHQMYPGDVLLLENLRFHKGEEENSPEFVAKLAKLCDIYVSDAFGTVHRAHASTAGLAKMVKDRAMGFLIEKELEYLEPLREKPSRPFALIMGGSKVSDKIGVLEHFLDKVDRVFIGGAMAYSFLRAKGFAIGNSLADEKQITLAKKIIKGCDARQVKLLLPIDHIVSKAFNDSNSATTTEGVDIPDGKMGLDIGPQTRSLYKENLNGMKTIFWNGPMGVFEDPAFSKGTFELAHAIAGIDAMKLVGGGDSAAAIAQAKLEDKFSFISTGGGATLEYLEGKELPGLKALETGR